MMIEGSWDWGQLWVVFGLVVFAGSFLSGLLHIAPMGKRIEAVGPESPEGQELIRKIFASLRIELVFLYSIAFAMTVKPTFDDGWTVAARLGGASSRRSRRSCSARSRPRPRCPRSATD